MRVIQLGLVVSIVAACGGGTLDVTSVSDQGPDGAPDTTGTIDMGAMPTDTTTILDASAPADAARPPDMAGPDDAAVPADCEPGDCGIGASCQNNVCTCDAGLLGDPFVGCSAANPCANANCPAGSSCNADGSCSCDPFFSGDPATGCAPTAPAADLSTRTAADVCAIWTARYARGSQDAFLIDPVDTCDPGVMHPDERRDALHTTSRYRMLVGLNPVSHAASQQQNVQDCAMMHAANNVGLNHMPPATWSCFTQSGYAGCSSSNLASGIGAPGGTVGLYIQDPGTPSLGHRRWIFNPRMGATAFGHRGSWGSMYSFDMSRSHNPDFVAYPAPGAFPRSAIAGEWSIHGGASYSAQHTVTITNMGDGSNVPVTDVRSPVFGNLASTLAWSVQTSQLPVDTTYRITIRDSGGALVREYDTTLVNCP